MASAIQIDDVFSPRLSEVAEINPRFDRSAISDTSEPVSFVPMANVSERTGSITSEMERPISEVLKGFTPFQQGDVLVAKITPCFENGKIAHAEIERRFGFGSTEFHVVRARRDALDGRYLYHFLRLDRIRLKGERKMTGSAGQRRVPKHFLENLRIPLPPLEEQRRIAAILDKADALRAKRREAIAKLDQLLQSVFLEMFGDPVSNPKAWPLLKSGDLFREKPRIGTTKPATGSGCLILRVGELGAAEIRFQDCSRAELTSAEVEKYHLASGDIVLARAIGSQHQLGKCSFFEDYQETICIDSHVMRLRPKSDICDPIWFYFLISSPAGKAMLQHKGGATSVQFNINAKQASDLDIPLPPLAAQRKFSKLWRLTAKNRRNNLTGLCELDRLFHALQQRVFAGRS